MNPVLREGNSDRRAPKAVKEYARKNPHSDGRLARGLEDPRLDHGCRRLPLTTRSRSPSPTATTVRIEHVASDGSVTVLKDGIELQAGEIIDGTFMSKKALVAFLGGADRGRQGAGRPLLPAHEGHDDEGLGPHHLRPRGARLLRGGLREARRRSTKLGVDVNNGFGRPARARSPRLPDAERKADRGRHRGGLRAARARDGELRQGHHQPPRSQRHHHRRLHAAHDPRFGRHVERRPASCRTARP